MSIFDRSRANPPGPLWLIPVVHVWLVLMIVGFAGVVIFLGATTEPPEDGPDPTIETLVLPILSGVHVATSLLVVLAGPPILRSVIRAQARTLAQKGYDEPQFGQAAIRACWSVSIAHAVAPEAVASTGLMVCLVAPVLHASAVFYVNAVTTPLALVYMALRFPTRSRREQIMQRFADLVREEEGKMEEGRV